MIHLRCMRCSPQPPTHHSSVSINTNTNPPTIVQSSLLPVPPCIKDHIIHGEFIDFSSLLPKARFIVGSEPETNKSFTLHFAPMNNDI